MMLCKYLLEITVYLPHTLDNGAICLFQDCYQEFLEENYMSGRRECQFKVARVTLIIKQTEMVQVNSRTGRRRNIKRIPAFFVTR